VFTAPRGAATTMPVTYNDLGNKLQTGDILQNPGKDLVEIRIVSADSDPVIG
jgi:FlaG/FlaF family flagellin (archaellin)